DWHVEVRKLTSGRGVDQVIEIGGGATMEKSLRSTAIEGLVNYVGGRADGSQTIDARLLFTSVATVRVVAAGTRAHFVAMNRAIEATKMRPVIDRPFPFAEIPAALRYLEKAQPLGKVVITY